MSFVLGCLSALIWCVGVTVLVMLVLAALVAICLWVLVYKERAHPMPQSMSPPPSKPEPGWSHLPGRPYQ